MVNSVNFIMVLIFTQILLGEALVFFEVKPLMQLFICGFHLFLLACQFPLTHIGKFQSNNDKKSYIIFLVVIISFLGISATWVITKANQSIQELPPVIKKVPDFEMVSHLGKPFNQDSLINKISILDSWHQLSWTLSNYVK